MSPTVVHLQKHVNETIFSVQSLAQYLRNLVNPWHFVVMGEGERQASGSNPTADEAIHVVEIFILLLSQNERGTDRSNIFRQ